MKNLEKQHQCTRVFGEVLFDCFPDGTEVLGGAPFNVAWNCCQLGQNVEFISAIGNDDRGKSVRRCMALAKLDDSRVATHGTMKTGEVNVALTKSGPAYSIEHPRAWDEIHTPEPVAHCELLYFGSLAWRSPINRETLRRLGQKASCRFVDLNLRPPHFDSAWLDEILDSVAWCKINEAELAQLTRLPTDTFAEIEKAALHFADRFNVDNIIVTAGSLGAMLLAGRETWSLTPAPTPTRMVDTVGAGDAFASIVICGLLRGWDFQTILKRASNFASAVCGLRGATSTNQAFYDHFVSDWNL